MPPELTKRELKERIKKLEKELAKRKNIEEELRESEEKYKVIFKNVNDLIIYVGIDGRFIELNDKLEDIFGYTRENIIGKHFKEIGVLSPLDMQRAMDVLGETTEGNVKEKQEYDVVKKDGSIARVEVNSTMIEKNGEIRGVINIIRDITQRKIAEEERNKAHDELERKVRDRTVNLEDANTALKVLLKKREEDKIELGEKVLHNVNDLIIPYLETLEKSVLNSRQAAVISIIRSNLDDIVSPFVRGLTSKHLALTPTEIQIANLIKHGKTTKETAAFLNLSCQTIEFHRKNIRKKIGIKNKRINLRTYLLSIQ